MEAQASNSMPDVAAKCAVDVMYMVAVCEMFASILRPGVRYPQPPPTTWDFDLLTDEIIGDFDVGMGPIRRDVDRLLQPAISEKRPFTDEEFGRFAEIEGQFELLMTQVEKHVIRSGLQ